jgi:hypothetical protein
MHATRRIKETSMRNLISIALVFTTACATQPSNAEDGIEGPGGKADGRTLPTGTYTNSDPKIGALVSLTLNSDHTFERTREGACPGGGSCAPESQTGVFLYTHSTTTSYLHFYDDTGASIDRAAWTLDGSNLTLSFDDATWSYSMTQTNACEAAGGSCVAASPGSCAVGSVGDPNQYGCDDVGPFSGECCLPPPVDNGCQMDTDCHGLLPQILMKCPDGSTKGARWSCENNQCEIAICE